jgi:hypothetical protein
MRKEEHVNGLNDEMFDQEYEGDFEAEMFADQEGDFEADFEADFESDQEGDFETVGYGGYGGYGSQGEGPFNEEQELELAAELLAVSEEAELDQFLGKLFNRVKGAAGQMLQSSSGQALKGLLKQTAKKALPMVGRAVGGYFGGATGSRIGEQLGNWGGRAFGLELEGMSPEDGELEVAKRFVRLAGDAAGQVARTAGSGSPQQAARNALAASARKHAPGLLRGATGGLSAAGRPTGSPGGARRCNCGNAGSGMTRGGAAYGGGTAHAVGAPSSPGVRPNGRSQNGQWYRRGRQIVLVGL